VVGKKGWEGVSVGGGELGPNVKYICQQKKRIRSGGGEGERQ